VRPELYSKTRKPSYALQVFIFPRVNSCHRISGLFPSLCIIISPDNSSLGTDILLTCQNTVWSVTLSSRSFPAVCCPHSIRTWRSSHCHLSITFHYCGAQNMTPQSMAFGMLSSWTKGDWKDLRSKVFLTSHPTVCCQESCRRVLETRTALPQGGR
jgi:hypothetical protein